MSVNRYRLKHLAQTRHRPAMLALHLLERPDRLLGIILIGSTLANNLLSMIFVLAAKHYFGDDPLMLPIASTSLTLIILIFAEIGPKSLAALYPQQVTFLAAYPLKWLLKILYPVVFLANGFVNGCLRLLGFNPTNHSNTLHPDELRGALSDPTPLFAHHERDMLIRTLDLMDRQIEEVMIPRNLIQGLDMNDDWEDITKQIASSAFARLPVYRDSLDEPLGTLVVRRALYDLSENELNKERLEQLLDPPCFMPEGSRLSQQVLRFRQAKARMGFVVDEYGEILGLVTLEDILEEMVGQFTTDRTPLSPEWQLQDDGSYLVTTRATLRELEERFDILLPNTKAKTIGAWVLAQLQEIPQHPIGLRCEHVAIEVLHSDPQSIKMLRVHSISPDEISNTNAPREC